MPWCGTRRERGPRIAGPWPPARRAAGRDGPAPARRERRRPGPTGVECCVPFNPPFGGRSTPYRGGAGRRTPQPRGASLRLVWPRRGRRAAIRAVGRVIAATPRQTAEVRVGQIPRSGYAFRRVAPFGRRNAPGSRRALRFFPRRAGMCVCNIPRLCVPFARPVRPPVFRRAIIGRGPPRPGCRRRPRYSAAGTDGAAAGMRLEPVQRRAATAAPGSPGPPGTP